VEGWRDESERIEGGGRGMEIVARRHGRSGIVVFNYRV